MYRDTGFQTSLFYRRFKVEAKNWKTEKETIIRCVLLNLAGVFIYAVGINSFAAPQCVPLAAPPQCQPRISHGSV